MKKVSTIVVVLLLLVISGHGLSTAEDVNRVTAVGFGTITGGDKAIARDAALSDALRNAVEEAVGTLVESSSIVSNFELISDEIYTKSDGYIRSYRVIDEEAIPSEKLYKVRVRAEVAIGEIRNDLAAIGLLLVRKHRPRMMVLMAESIGGNAAVSDTITESESAIIDKFMEKGFDFVNEEQAKNEIKRSLATAAVSGNDREATRLARRYGAEVIIVGKATSSSSGKAITGTRMKSISATVKAKAIRSDTGGVIAVVSESFAVPHLDETTGGAVAIKEVSEEAAVKLMDKILAKWSKEVQSLQTVRIVMTGVNFMKLKKFRSFLKSSIRGVKSVHQRSFTGGIGILDVDTKSDAQAMADEITTKKLDGFDIEITSLSANKIEIKVH